MQGFLEMLNISILASGLRREFYTCKSEDFNKQINCVVVAQISRIKFISICTFETLLSLTFISARWDLKIRLTDLWYRHIHFVSTLQQVIQVFFLGSANFFCRSLNQEKNSIKESIVSLQIFIRNGLSNWQIPRLFLILPWPRRGEMIFT